MSSTTARGWLIIQATRSQWVPSDRPPIITGSRIVKVTRKYPRSLEADQIAIELRLDVPDNVFNAYQGSFAMEITEEQALSGPVGMSVVSAKVESEREQG